MRRSGAGLGPQSASTLLRAALAEAVRTGEEALQSIRPPLERRSAAALLSALATALMEEIGWRAEGHLTSEPVSCGRRTTRCSLEPPDLTQAGTHGQTANSGAGKRRWQTEPAGRDHLIQPPPGETSGCSRLTPRPSRAVTHAAHDASCQPWDPSQLPQSERAAAPACPSLQEELGRGATGRWTLEFTDVTSRC